MGIVVILFAQDIYSGIKVKSLESLIWFIGHFYGETNDQFISLCKGSTMKLSYLLCGVTINQEM